MKNLSQTVLIVAIIFTVMLCIPVLIYNAGKNYYSNAYSNASVYEINWKINIPSSFKEIYHISGDRGFQGDGQRYTILEANEINASLVGTTAKNSANKDIEVQIGDSHDSRNKVIEQFVQETAKDLNVPEENKPAFDKFYRWKEFTKYGYDKLIILSFPDTHQVYFAELII